MAGSGPILKKKDCVTLALAKVSQSGPLESDILQEQFAIVNQSPAETERLLKETKQEETDRERAT